MAPGKKVAERTIVILDVETGSVGAALARLSPNEAPKMFAETRVMIPVSHTLDAGALARGAERAAREALHHTSSVAANIRQATTSTKSKKGTAPPLGEVSEAIVFLTPPWSTLVAGARGAQWQFEPALTGALAAEVEAVYGNIPVTFHAFGKAASQTTAQLFPQPYLLCNISGEMCELSVVKDNMPQSWGTLPLGAHTVLRTLQSHAGLTPAEARSALHLAHHESAPAHSHLHEPLAAAAAHYTGQFKNIAAKMLQGTRANGVLVVGEGAVADWFARALAADPSLLELFPQGGEVRALRHNHISPYVAAHALKPDLILMLEVLAVVYT